jgi:hypothetical protein
MPRPKPDRLADLLRDVLFTVRKGDELVNVTDAAFALADAVNYRGKEVANALESLARQVGRAADVLEKRP